MSKFLDTLHKTAKELELQIEDLNPTGMPATTATTMTSATSAANDPDAAVNEFIDSHPAVLQAKRIALQDHQKQLAAQAMAAQRQLQAHPA